MCFIHPQKEPNTHPHTLPHKHSETLCKMSPTTFYFARFSWLIFHFLCGRLWVEEEEEWAEAENRGRICWQPAQGTINHGHTAACCVQLAAELATCNTAQHAMPSETFDTPFLPLSRSLALSLFWRRQCDKKISPDFVLINAKRFNSDKICASLPVGQSLPVFPISPSLPALSPRLSISFSLPRSFFRAQS